jgi:hypothetical protein
MKPPATTLKNFVLKSGTDRGNQAVWVDFTRNKELGSLKMTEIYTHVSMRKLKDVRNPLDDFKF